VEGFLDRVGRVSRRSLFGRIGKLGLAVGIGSLGGAVSSFLQPMVAFAQGCISCVGGCVCAPSGTTGVSCCTGVDPWGVETRCCVIVEGTCARPVYYCSTDTCTYAYC
jgi:hypothetical protein